VSTGNVSTGTDLVLVVTDDGIGPTNAAAAAAAGPAVAAAAAAAAARAAASGFGLRNMEARASALGGTFSLRRHEPQGTRVEWRVPLSAAPTPDTVGTTVTGV
jgi:signal transduction histidine kinase